MGCTESTPVVQPQPVIYTYTVPPNVPQNYPKHSEDPVNFVKPPPYNPNFKPQYGEQYYVPQYGQVYVQQYPQYPVYRNQPSTLGTVGAVAGGVVAGNILSDLLFD